MEFDDQVVECFLKNQLQLFPEEVATDAEDARDFLEDAMAVVLKNPKEVMEYLEEVGIDTEGMSREELLDIEEVFEVGDGRYLVLEL